MVSEGTPLLSEPEEGETRARRTRVVAFTSVVSLATLGFLGVNAVGLSAKMPKTAGLSEASSELASALDRPFAKLNVRKMYYVNLDSSEDRRASMEAQLADMAHERVVAVSANSLSDLGGELGDYMVRYAAKCDGACSESDAPSDIKEKFGDNKGLCCLAAISAFAAEDLSSPFGTGCPHMTAGVLGWESSASTCYHMMANWASHMKALEAAYADFPDPGPDDAVIIFEDDAMVPADWREKLQTSTFAKKPEGEFKSGRDIADAVFASAAFDEVDWDYMRADLMRFEVMEQDWSLYAMAPNVPDLAGVDFSEFQGKFPFAYGAGAILVKATSIPKVISALSDQTHDIDIALNVATARGELSFAVLADPVFGKDQHLNSVSTLTGRLRKLLR